MENLIKKRLKKLINLIEGICKNINNHFKEVLKKATIISS